MIMSVAVVAGDFFRPSTYLNLSMQSIPFGSSLLYTKQLNASLNSGPHGPCAIPPRHGQSQLISPVSSLNAPSCDASSSNASGESLAPPSIGTALVAAAACVSGDDAVDGGTESAEAGEAVAEVCRDLRDAAMASTVGRFSSSVSAIGRRAVESRSSCQEGFGTTQDYINADLQTPLSANTSLVL